MQEDYNQPKPNDSPVVHSLVPFLSQPKFTGEPLLPTNTHTNTHKLTLSNLRIHPIWTSQILSPFKMNLTCAHSQKFQLIASVPFQHAVNCSGKYLNINRERIIENDCVGTCKIEQHRVMNELRRACFFCQFGLPHDIHLLNTDYL